MKPQWWIIFVLTFIIVLLLIFRRKPDSSKEKLLEAKIEQREQAIHQLSRENTKQAEKIKADSLRFTKAIQAGQVTILKQSRRISDLKANPETVTIIRENPLIGGLIQSYDSLVIEQANQIELQGKYIDTLRIDMKEMKDNFSERLELQSQTIADLTALTTDQRKQLRKTRRSVTLLKVLAVIGTVGGLFLGGSL